MMLPMNRLTPLLALPASLRPLIAARLYATQTGLGSTSPQSMRRRRSVTVLNDDGRVPWGDLSAKEKAARTTQQTVNFSLIILGTVLTGGVAYFLYTEVFAIYSKTSHFNRAVDRIKQDPQCIELLGNSKKILAFGEPTSNKWAKARPIASSHRQDSSGAEHVIMHFNVEGPLNKGVVNLHLIKRLSQSEYEYKYLFLDVKGHSRIYLENQDATASGAGKQRGKIFGIQWTR